MVEPPVVLVAKGGTKIERQQMHRNLHFTQLEKGVDKGIGSKGQQKIVFQAGYKAFRGGW